MFRQTIFGLSTALVLLTATVYSSDDEEHRGISFIGTRMPILSSSSGGGGMTSLAGGAAIRGLDADDHEAPPRAHSSSASSTVVISGPERGLRTLYQQLASSPLAPIVDLNEVLHLNNTLFAKYQPYVQTGFRAPDSSTLSSDFFAFLVTNRQALSGLGDPTNLRIFSGFLDHIKKGLFVGGMENFPDTRLPDSGQVFLAAIARSQHDKLTINLPKGLTLLKEVIMMGYQPASLEDILQPAISQLRKIVTIDGVAVYDLPSQYDALSAELSGWFNVMRRMYDYEAGFWAKEAPLMAGLLADYKAAMTSLTAEDTQLYSGVALMATSVGLIPTAKADKQEDRKDLIAQITAHMTANKGRIEAYQAVEKSLPTLQKVKAWLDDIFDYVKKNGRIT